MMQNTTATQPKHRCVISGHGKVSPPSRIYTDSATNCCTPIILSFVLEILLELAVLQLHVAPELIIAMLDLREKAVARSESWIILPVVITTFYQFAREFLSFHPDTDKVELCH